MSEEKKYDPEMRGALYYEPDNEGKEKYPIASGTITISGLELRIAMWPSRVSKGDSKKKYWPVKVEYKQGATKFLVPIEPRNVVATGTAADASAVSTDVGDMPF